MKIAVVAPGTLPIPSVKDGAIETLTTLLIEENELAKNHELIVYSCWDAVGARSARDYAYTEVIWHKKPLLVESVYNFVMRAFRVLTGCRKPVRTYFIRQALRDMVNREIDMILVEGNVGQAVQIKEAVNVPVVLHLHTDLLHRGSKHGDIICSSCDEIWCVSSYISSRVLEVDCGRPPVVKIFRNCIDTTMFNAERYGSFRREFRANYDLKDADKLIMFCGRIDESKGVKELIEACYILDDGYKLMIIGKSWFHSSSATPFEQEMADLSKEIQDRVFFVGYVPHKELAKYYAAADFFVMPSKCNEAAGLVVLEALSSGLPVVASNVGGIPEYANSDACTLVAINAQFVHSLAREMNCLISDQSIFELKKSYARVSSQQYSKENYYLRFCELVDGVFSVRNSKNGKSSSQKQF